MDSESIVWIVKNASDEEEFDKLRDRDFASSPGLSLEEFELDCDQVTGHGILNERQPLHSPRAKAHQASPMPSGSDPPPPPSVERRATCPARGSPSTVMTSSWVYRSWRRRTGRRVFVTLVSMRRRWDRASISRFRSFANRFRCRQILLPSSPAWAEVL